MKRLLLRRVSHEVLVSSCCPTRKRFFFVARFSQAFVPLWSSGVGWRIVRYDECPLGRTSEAQHEAHTPNAMADLTAVVGHKTFYSAERGYWHEPLTLADANEIIARADAEDARRKALIPDEAAAIRLFFDAHLRLKELGWREAIYCPKDGTEFLVIEPGSTGQHRCIYMGEWPKGSWWIQDDEGGSPSRPALFKPLPSGPEGRDDGTATAVREDDPSQRETLK
jgi:hypothetical protein